MHIFLVDIYAERFHKGLNGIPARRWEAAMAEGFSPRLPPSAQELLILLGRVAYRKIQHYGIDFLNLRYNSPDLALLRNRLNGEQAKIKYHPGDLSRVYVHDPFDGVYVIVPALAEDYANGLSVWKHRIICEYVRSQQDEVDLAALGRAKRKIQEIVDGALRRKRRRSGKKLGRWQSSGRPPSLARASESAPSAPISPAPPLPQGTPAESSVTLPPADYDNALSVEQTDEEGWGISYRLPKSSDLPGVVKEALDNDTA